MMGIHTSLLSKAACASLYPLGHALRQGDQSPRSSVLGQGRLKSEFLESKPGVVLADQAGCS